MIHWPAAPHNVGFYTSCARQSRRAVQCLRDFLKSCGLRNARALQIFLLLGCAPLFCLPHNILPQAVIFPRNFVRRQTDSGWTPAVQCANGAWSQTLQTRWSRTSVTYAAVLQGTGAGCSAAAAPSPDLCLVSPPPPPPLTSHLPVELETKVIQCPKVPDDFKITEKSPTRAFSWLKVPTMAFTFETLC